MQLKLPFSPLNAGTEFIHWYFVGVPKSLFTIGRRLTILINNEFTLTLNLRLLFTPLYGDYTWIGRLVGFVFRITKLLISLPFLLIIGLFSIIFPFLWFLVPIVLVYYLKGWFIFAFLFTFIAYELLKGDHPKKRVSEVDESNLFECFKKDTLDHLENVYSKGKFGVQHLQNTQEIKDLLQLLELGNTDFADRFTQAYDKVDYYDLINSSYKFAKATQTRYVELEHLYLGILENTPKIEVFLSQYGTKMEYFSGAVRWVYIPREEEAKKHFWQKDYEIPHMGGVDRGLTGRVTPFLDAHSHDLTKQAQYKKFKKPIGKDKVIEQMVSILSGASEKNVIIVGEPGSGKTSVVKALAHEIVYGTQKDTLKFKRIVSLDGGLLVSGAHSFGQIAENITKLMEEVEGSGGIILFIDEIHNLLASESHEPGEDIAGIFSILEPYVSSGNNQFIAATSIKNYRKYIEGKGSFSRLFEVVEVPPATPEVTLQILEEESYIFQEDYNIRLSYPALVKTVEYAKKLMHERVFPDKAIVVLKRACASKSGKKSFLVAEDIAKEISDMTHVPVSAISEDEYIKLLNIEDEMHSMVIGQNQAISQIGAAIKRARVGIRDESKPIASFLFVGTTGVGKTQTAKSLAKHYFGDVNTMIRLDMSEYQHPDSIKTLLGSPDGGTEGYLTSKVRSQPFALILLDEIEKAHPNVLLTFLQVLDDGRLTDASGRTIDFTNTIIIATSNVGTRAIQDVAQKGGLFEEMEKVAMNDVRQHFAPEFLNRFNGIIVFRPLKVGDMREITKLLLERVREMADKNNLKVEFTPELINALAKKGYDPQYGARPLERVIENYVETHIAEKMLRGEFETGDQITLGLEVLMTESGELKFDDVSYTELQ